MTPTTLAPAQRKNSAPSKNGARQNVWCTELDLGHHWPATLVAPRIPEFDEVKDKVTDLVKKQKAKEQVEQKAKDLLAGTTTPDALKAAGEKEGFDAGLEEGYRMGSTLGKAGSSTALDDLIYSLKPGEMTKAPIKVDDKWVIAGLVKKKDADLAEFAKTRDQLKESMISERQSQVFEDYVAALQEKMKREGKIKIYDDVLETLPEDEEPGLPPGLNFPGGPGGG